MADTTGTLQPPGGKMPLDVGRMISQSFGLYFKNLPVFFLIVFIPTLIFELFFNRLFASNFQNDPSDVLAMLAGTFGSLFVYLVLMILAQAVIVRMAVSLQVGQGSAVGKAISAALAGFFPILILGILVGLMTGIGLVFLIVPGLYIMAMFYVMVPTIVFENAGFGALERSLKLTENYRWAIIGTAIVLIIIIWIVSAIGGAILVGAFMATGGSDTFLQGNTASYPIWFSVLNAAISSLAAPLSLIASGVVYARLKEIKEGGQAGDLLKVFE
ncbi:hypothetical protein HXX25_09930 [Hyphobacterium sp. CCMP332]|jgi:hypothetical protein|uniref:hypothetical protein n=1 Tax=Hyphobacterium sp. CCMP332 TaxID=2749086 RepID=UPI00164F49FD|nr:hypothetical protein [Hyphobacterium sp. CCMP332]QNL19611.1 hypothetical protein HXX25_09930 [Hyphobacterium sp. CCMP332]